MQAIGIEKGKPFSPDAKTKAMLEKDARIGGAIGRVNTFEPPATYYYPDRKWQGIPGGLPLPSPATGSCRSMPGTMFTTWPPAIRPP